MPTPLSATGLRLMWLAACLAAVTPALTLAQSVPRYTVRELVKPTAAQYCGFGANINARGDVVSSCRYAGGTRNEAVLSCLLPPKQFCYTYNAQRAWAYDLPAIWPASGGTRALNVPEKSSLSQAFILNQGDVVALGKPIDARGYPTQDRQQVWQFSAGSQTGKLMPPPAGLAAELYTLELAMPTGLQWWTTGWRGDQVMINAQGQRQPMPALPDTGEPVHSVDWLAIGPGGHVLASRSLYTDASQQTLRQDLWLLTEGAWRPFTPPVDSTLPITALAFNDAGHLLLTDSYSSTYILRPEQNMSVQAIPTNQSKQASVRALDNADRIYGEVAFTGHSKVTSHATLWANGQAFDINTLVNGLPKAWHLSRVVASNGQGQLVANVVDTSKVGNASAKMVVLSPLP